MIVLCDYCKAPAQKVNGLKLYPHRGDLKRLTFWYCDNGHEPAYVGCHKAHPVYSPNGDTPLGRLADENLRTAKKEAHAFFDPLWREKIKFRSRTEAYNWLANQLGIPVEECHIGMFDVDTCARVSGLCESVLIDAMFD